ncbi:endoplasmic reticulum junction formation protein lunapark-B [Exaiptasia diaphana]|uniref:Endoplasmic reticulum junction formation protein lunapark n=1 Tax=Exaiptasia diaphana TaxID=2652724 RepID=A0A913Y2F4_EXADI|nr:endoplasmic reticulum junction formation protein lunapark-B [Exaiptasia diaphana]KXJ23332.1 Protein lunapark-B [Exaiptasia diaphana]
MGLIFSRWKKKKTSEEILQELQKDIETIESSQYRNEHLRKKYIGMLLLYSVLLYIIVALVFYFKYFPTNWKDRVVRTLPLLIFPLVIYGVKRLLHYIFVSRMTKNARKLEDLKEKKKSVLEEVMEKETYKTAKELLDKYDPDSEIVKDNKKESNLPASQPQSPVVMNGHSSELRRRNVAGAAPSPGGTLQKAVSVPSLTGSLPPSPQRRLDTELSPGTSPGTPQRANSMSNISGPTVQPIPQGAFVRPPGPPKPIFPVLPRERSTMDKVVEYLVGDGPSNRYALICKQCLSHNGMALKEEFEYVAFRCCYCFYFNPARKQRPIAPKLEDDPMTPGRSRKNPPSPPRPTGQIKQEIREITTTEEEEDDDDNSDEGAPTD